MVAVCDTLVPALNCRLTETGSRAKFAVTLKDMFICKLHVLDVWPAHARPQETKVEPEAGAAVKVTYVPLG